MKKKIIFGIILCIIIAGAIVIGTIGLNVDLIYRKNVRVDAYIGKEFESKDIEQMVKEIFGEGKVIVQKVEYYEDMASILIEEKNADNIDEKIKTLNDKINEKYEVENDLEESITVTYQPKVRLYSILSPYIIPIAISAVIILVYVAIRYRKLGIWKTLALYVISILMSEALYLSIIAITRIPVNRLIIPIGLLIYVLVVTILTIIQENKYNSYKEEQSK